MSILFVIVWVVIILTFVTVIIGSTKIHLPERIRGAVSSDGHRVSADQDLTCETAYGHSHEPGSEMSRYIVHEDPPEGYLILNGVKRSLEECKYL